MSKRHPIFFTIALAVLFSAYVGYKFYDIHDKPAPIGKAIEFKTSKEIESTARTFLQGEETLTQLPRETAIRSSSLTPPVWAYTSEKWDTSPVYSVKAIALVTGVVDFPATKLPDGNVYRLPLPKEKTLVAGDAIIPQQVILRIFTPHENATDIGPRNLDERRLPDKSPIPYPLIAKILNSPDDASLTQLGNWIKSVGGAARAQSLIEAAGLSDSIRIETATVLRQ